MLSCDDEQGRAPCGGGAGWARETLGSREVVLDPAWRYGGDLLDAAHAVVSSAGGGAEAPRRAAGPPTRVRFWRSDNERAEAQAVAREIESTLAEGELKMADLCIAVPRGGGRQGAIAAALEERRIPHRIAGPGLLLQTSRGAGRDRLAPLAR